MNPLTYWRDWWATLSAVEKTVAILVTVAIILVLIFVSPAEAEPAARVQLFVPIDVVALTTIVLTFISTMVTSFIGVYVVIVGARAKRAEIASVSNAAVISKVKDTVDLVERNTNSLTTQIAAAARLAGMHEGEAKGRAAGEDAARTLAEGQRQGTETERASVAAAAMPAPVGEQPVLTRRDQPIPVADNRTATATERTATASERVADAAERSADKGK